MSTATMSKLEKIDYFLKKRMELQAKYAEIQAIAQSLDKEWDEFMETEIGVKGDGTVHISEIMKKTLESTIEQSQIIRP